MKKAKPCLLITASAVLVLLINATDAALPFKKVALATTAASPTSTTTTAAEPDAEPVSQTAETEDSKTDAANKNSKLTGIPQIDYIWDPNLPRELRGYNLSSYPFFSSVPPEEEIHFKCDGLHDGFYASIEHKCQLYHHCVYGIRHDFLCANFTAFDQKTFICHFVSDVDCQGSQKYWNRNDELYMATTTTSTTTTTTEPPPTPRRRAQRPQHPLRRPYNRRPVDDFYYYDEEYEDDYFEPRLNHRRKQRPRQRKPIMSYEEEYEDKPYAFDIDDEKPRRNNNRFRDEDESQDDYYENDRRFANRPKPRQNKPAADRRKTTANGRKAVVGRGDERRSFNEERQLNGRKNSLRTETKVEAQDGESSARRLTGRRRITEKRTTPLNTAALDDLDDYEKPHGSLDQEEAAEEEAPQKVRSTPKPLEEFITPKAAPSSVYARPRAPPRIARPVPINDKKKFQYPVQKFTPTTQNPTLAAAGAADDGDDYYQQGVYDYIDTREQHNARYRNEEDDAPVGRRRKLSRNTLRKPITDKKVLLEDDDYDNLRSSNRHRPLGNHAHTTAHDDVDFIDDDYEETRPVIVKPAYRLRSKVTARKNTLRSRQPAIDEEQLDDEILERPTMRNRLLATNQARRNKPALNTRSRTSVKTTPAPAETEKELPEDVVDTDTDTNTHADDTVAHTVSANKTRTNPYKPATSVRVVKRPFLPSRGGSPYLPRGLQPVGIALKPLHEPQTTSTPIDMGSTISGIRSTGDDFNESAKVNANADVDADADADESDAGAHADAVDYNNHQAAVSNMPTARTTLPPRSALPVSASTRRAEPQTKINLDQLYENNYDVTLNDALDPTLKPLPSLPQHLQHYNPNYASASYTQDSSYNPFMSTINTKTHLNNNKKIYQQQTSSSAYQNHQYNSRSYQAPSLFASNSNSASSTMSTTQQQQQQQHANYNSDSYFSSADIHRHAIAPSQIAYTNRNDYRTISARIAQHFYDDFDY